MDVIELERKFENIFNNACSFKNVIRKLLLENWTSHKKSEFEFSNANIFIGVIGSGKSSVVEAISFALFGSFPALNSRELTLADIVRSGEKKARVEIEVEARGKTINIIRTIEKSNSKAKTSSKLFVDKKLVSESTQEINLYIEKFLEIDLQTFMNTLYAPQNKLEAIVELSPTERRKLVDELINLSRLEKAHKNSITLSNRLSRMLKEYKNQMKEIDIEEANKKIEAIEMEMKTIESKLSTEQNKAKEIEQEYVKEKLEYETELEKKNRYEKLLNEKSRIEGMLAELKEVEEAKTPDISKMENSIEELKNKIKENSRELEILNHKKDLLIYNISKLERELKTTIDRKKEINEIENKLTQFKEERDVNVLKEEREKLLSKIAEAKSRIEEARKSRSGIEKADAKCPLCLQPLSKHSIDEVKKHWNEEIEKNTKFVEQLAEKEMELRKEITELEKRMNEKTKLEEKLEYLKENIGDEEKLKNEIKNLNYELENTKKRIENAEKTREEMLKKHKEINMQKRNAVEIIEKKRRLRILKEKVVEAKKRMEEIKFDRNKIEELREKLTEKAKILAEKKANIRNWRNALIDKKQLNDEIKKRVEIYNKMKKRVSRINAILEDVGIAKTVIEITQKEARKNLLDSINLSLNMIWKLIYPYSDYKSAKIEAGENSYLFYINDGNEWKELERVASGGEKTIFVLALRLAVASVLMGKLDFIILDEPTHNLDDRSIEKLSEVINTELNQITNQFFIITHDERLKNIENGKIFYFERKKENNEATEVKEI